MEFRVDALAAIAHVDRARVRLRGALADPVGRGLFECGQYVARKAVQNAPVYTGALRASIVASPPEVDLMGEFSVGSVGSDLEYAPFVEFGTRPFWPPPGALTTWAARKGIPEFLVQRAIAKRGIKPKRFLQRAFTESAEYIRRRMARAVREAVQK